MSPRAEDSGTSGREEAWRCFVAVRLADPARSAVAEYLDRVRAAVDGVAWTRSDQLHLTLKFLGDVPASRVPEIAARLGDALQALPACTLEVAGIGAFPNLARPQVLWVGVRALGLARLSDVVETSCAAEGFPRETRPFRPHVTLGRIRTRARRIAPDLALLVRDGDRTFGASPVGGVTLFRSQLGAGGARHAVLAEFPVAHDAGIP